MKNLRVIIKMLILIISVSRGFAQTSASCPFITPVATPSSICPGQCTNLSATALLTKTTTTYSVQSIPHAPPIAYGAGGGTGVSVNIDDVWSNVINLPFSFCFYGNVYNQIIIGSNGNLSFDLTRAGLFCPWSFTGTVPSTTNLGATSNPGNIFGPYHDIDPSVCGNVNYYTTGTAPCRKFIVSYNNICQYSCTSIKSRHMIVLNELTNYIDVYVESKPTCASWNGGRAVIGIQNNGGTQGIAAPGRNTGNWSVSTPEGWRFVPNGVNNWSITWSGPSGTIASNTLGPVNVCPTTNTTYTASLSITNCNNSVSTFTNTVSVNITSPVTPTFSSISPICQGGNISLPTTSNNGIIGTWSPAPNNNTTTTYTFTPNSNQCALTNSVTISVNQPTNSTTNQTICGNQLPYNWNGLVLNSSGTSTVTLTSSSGCDSIATLNLSINPTQTSTTNTTICDGQLPYVWNGISINSSGTTTTQLVSSLGCDSLAILNLNVNSSYITQSNLTICDVQLPYQWNGLTFNGSGSQTAYLTSIYGCDSLSTLNLTVNPTQTSTTNLTICQDELPFYWNGLSITSSGNQSVSLISQNGCDSVANLNLSVNQLITPTFTQLQSICIGDTFSNLPSTSLEGISGTWSPNFTNQATTTYNFTPDTGQCSQNSQMTVVVNNLTVPTFSQPGAICQYEYLPPLPTQSQNGITGTWSPLINNGITTQYTFTPQFGSCSDTVEMQIVVNSNPIINLYSSTNETCGNSNGSISINSISPGTAPFNWTINGVSNSTGNFSNLSSGSYQIVVQDSNYCKDTIQISVLNIPGPTIINSTSSPSNCGLSDGLISIDSITGGTGPFSITVNGVNYINTAVIDSLASGNYTISVTDNNGCQLSSNVTVSATGGPNANFDLNPSQGQAPLLVSFSNTSTTPNAQFYWNLGLPNSDTTAFQPQSQIYNSEGTYQVTLIASNGIVACNDTITKVIFVDLDALLIIPNIFSPNGDGANDNFFITSEGMKSLDVTIFNRWGTVMSNFDGIAGSWDGRNGKGELATDGTYFYIVTGSTNDSKPIDVRGYLMLVR